MAPQNQSPLLINGSKFVVKPNYSVFLTHKKLCSPNTAVSQGVFPQGRIKMEQQYKNENNGLLAIDIGNTHTVAGLYLDGRLMGRWRIRSERYATEDELAIKLNSLPLTSMNLFSIASDVIISSVVPPLTEAWERMTQKYFGCEALVILKNIDHGMPIRYSRPFEIGADRIVNAIAAWNRFHTAIIAIDFGTATTFDCISARGEYLGGAISPGLKLASEMLSSKTSKLPLVELDIPPGPALAQDTVSAIRSGIIYGFAALADGLASRLKEEFDSRAIIIATGGFAATVASHSRLIEKVLPDLTLEGLYLIYRRYSTGRRHA